MRKKIMIPMLVAIAGLVLTLAMTAFRSGSTEKKEEGKTFANYYFRYNSAAGDDENSYENVNNWTYLPGGNPNTDPCDGVDQMVCVLEAPFTSTPTAQDLVDYLSARTPLSTGAEDYCQNISHIKWEKPIP